MEAFLQLFRQRYIMVAFGLLLVGLIVGAVWVQQPRQESDSADSVLVADETLIDAPLVPTIEPQIVVYISGAVQAPEVYSLPATARVKDLVIAAGGLTADADGDQINLAAPLSDGAHIIIVRRGETTSAAAGAAETIDINTASAKELEALSGIGVALSARIVSYRDENGAFANTADLQNVQGISATLYDKIASRIRVGPAN